MPREELRTEIIRLLRQARRARKPRARGEDRRGQIPGMVSIHVRPPEIDERGVPGASLGAYGSLGDGDALVHHAI